MFDLRQLESGFNPSSFRVFMRDYSYRIGLPAIGLYLLMVHRLPNFMKERAALDLKLPLIFWNLLLSVFSFIGAYKCVPQLVTLVQTEGFRGPVCSNYFYTSSPENFWLSIFVLSKLPELNDTLFLILRKRRVILLHWYHHATVLAYSWFPYHHYQAGGLIFGSMNYMVHAIMYLYYAIMATKMIRFPKFVSVIITSLQIVQMIVGCAVQIGMIYYYWYLGDDSCQTSSGYIVFGSVIYGSYFVLFSKFFAKSYLSGRKQTKVE